MTIEVLEKKTDTEVDLKFWRWALSVLTKYGPYGMSSDESDSATKPVNGPDSVYRVKAMVWRRRIEDLLEIVDGVRHSNSPLFSLQGSTGIKRVRPNYNILPAQWPQSNRDPPKGLPYSFYHDPWFNMIDPKTRQRMIGATSENFKWHKGFRA